MGKVTKTLQALPRAWYTARELFDRQELTYNINMWHDELRHAVKCKRPRVVRRLNRKGIFVYRLR